MSNKKLITIIIILAVIVVANIFGIFFLDNLLSKPIASYSVEVFGATFAESVSESNVVEINLIRPPRQVVNPGTTNLVNSKITNTHDEAIYVRATYKVDIENEDGIQTIGLHDDVSINTAEGWFYVDGYWYYEKPVDANCTINGLIESVYYSDTFSKCLDYNVYIPVLVESVVVNGDSVYEATGWKNINIQSINPHDYLPTETSWVQNIAIIN